MAESARKRVLPDPIELDGLRSIGAERVERALHQTARVLGEHLTAIARLVQHAGACHIEGEIGDLPTSTSGVHVPHGGTCQMRMARGTKIALVAPQRQFAVAPPPSAAREGAGKPADGLHPADLEGGLEE